MGSPVPRGRRHARQSDPALRRAGVLQDRRRGTRAERVAWPLPPAPRAVLRVHPGGPEAGVRVYRSFVRARRVPVSSLICGDDAVDGSRVAQRTGDQGRPSGDASGRSLRGCLRAPGARIEDARPRRPNGRGREPGQPIVGVGWGAMGKWLQWIVLTALTGNPILAGVIVLLVWWVADRFTLGILPDPFRFTRRWMRAATLRRQLAANPSDRRARLELAALLLERKRYADALALVKPNVEAGDHDPSTLFVMAQACLGTGHAEQGELFLDEVIERDPNFRMGEVHLERGRWRLQRKDAQGALRALQELASARPGTVEGKVLLARAQRALGDDAAAAEARREAWREYASAPRFQRRRDRLWAWRAKPSRPLLYAAIALACGVLFTRLVAPTVQRAIAADQRDEDRDWG